MPCSSDHFIPILDELQARVDREQAIERANARKGRGWGGRRPGAGAPRGNLNAFKHGRNSRRQAEILEAVVQFPGVQDALAAIAKHNRLRRKQAEEGFGVLMTRLLERTAALVLAQSAPAGIDQEYDQDQDNQEFLAFLNDATAQMRIILQKRSRPGRTTIKLPNSNPGGPQ